MRVPGCVIIQLMYDVISVGRATLDVFIKSKQIKTVRDPEHLRSKNFATGEAECLPLGGKLEIPPPVFAIGGGGANSATTFARQELKSAAILSVGRDLVSQSIKNHLRQEGIRPLLTEDKKHGTAYSVVLLAQGGERTILHYPGASSYLNKGDISWPGLRAGWFYLAPGDIPLGLVLELARAGRKNRGLIAINPSDHYLKMGADKLKPLLSLAEVVVVNREEAAFLTKADYRDEKEIFRRLDKMIGGLAVMTDGPRGALASDGRNIYSAPKFKYKGVADRTGAGDAFGSGFVAGLVRRQSAPPFSPEDIVFSLTLGSANATSVVEQVGAQAGILTRSGFDRSARWRKLKIQVDKIKQ